VNVNVIGALNNTPEEVAKWLDKAREICYAEFPDEPVPEAVLIKVFELLASKTMVVQQPQPVGIDPRLLTPGLSGPR
jgi:hypothetical protein